MRSVTDLGGPVSDALMVVAGGFLSVRFFQWLCHFLTGRWDSRQQRLEDREKRVDASMGKRMRNLERQVVELSAELRRYKHATDVLTIEVMSLNPSSVRLSEVQRLLARQLQVLQPNDVDLDDTMDDVLRNVK